ncbi:MAG: PEP-CTERM sorting domain-containing protein [Terriglobales bacterium]
MNDAAIGKGVRRRRSWYRRRLRMRRILVAVVVVTVLAGACWQTAARYFSLPSWHASQALPASFWMRGNVHNILALMAARSAKATRPLAPIPSVYPYSVVPGGVKDPDDLRYAALRDYVVRRHYAHFDYSHARLVRATEAREVYLSYRIRNTVFWTRRRVRLHLGELLLTDGKITARARCGNQISDTAKPEVSNEEPAEDVTDQPVAAIESAPSFPTRPMFGASDLPAGAPLAPKLAAGFFFPYVPVSVPIPSGVCSAGEIYTEARCHKPPKKPVMPEPSTLVLLASGLALIAWRYRKTAVARPT